MQHSKFLFVCILTVTCLSSLLECWTVESSVSLEHFQSQSDHNTNAKKYGERNIEHPIKTDENSLQIAADQRSRVEENSGGSNWNQSKVEDGEITIEPEATVDGLHEDNWCRAMRRWSTTVFGFPLHEEQDNWPEFKLSWRTVSAIILGACGAALSSAGGLGGGALFVPLFNLLLQFDTKTSAALSNFMILGGSLANLYRNIRESHPSLNHKPLIDFDVVLLVQPNMLLGISTGVILNVVLPDWVITLLLTITLFYMSQHSFKCGIQRWKKETHQNRLRLTKSPPYVQEPDFHHDGLISAEENGHDNGETDWTEAPESEDANALHQPLLSKKVEKMKLPVISILALAFTWLAFFAVQVLRGAKDNKSILGFEACGLGYWLITSTQIPIAICITAWTIRRICAAYACKENPDCQQDDGFVLKPESCMLFVWVALFTGVLGGLLGIGGGTIINPILLTVGMIPQVTAATCASMVFFSSSMSVVQFWLMGRVPIEFALSGALLCAISSFVGVALLHRAVAKYNRASLIVFSVTAVIGLSAVLMAGFGGVGIWQEFDSGAYMGFHYPC